MKSSLPNIAFALVLLIITLFLVHCQAQNSPKDYVAAHNAARAAVGVGPLAWSTTVAAYAQQYANQRVDCQLVHSSDSTYGENIAEGYGSYGAALSGVEAVKLWISEKSSYDHRSNSCINGECLHYTQVVWRESVRLGCARVVCQNGGAFVTCNYDPPGNYIGELPY
ncbi:hypothetical protein SOVF_134250 [Spinacia oleracea]|uniref:Pathogenesis-related protein 1A-like n=1 Tax=Spinacia oleracea TaxID=3562 RepID=A0A9R0INR9_SPIOL|nr:pathogenesis-related protein 1A-like [Spinacia oleracea]KNA11533.1 hypothetical protein SOVF_134250 [Spinacia oleracea]